MNLPSELMQYIICPLCGEHKKIEEGQRYVFCGFLRKIINIESLIKHRENEFI